MSTNWKAGDRAVCVSAFSGFFRGTNIKYDDPLPRVGTIYLVDSPVWTLQGLGLDLCGMGGPYNANRFRKVVPACDRSEREQTELIPHEGFWNK